MNTIARTLRSHSIKMKHHNLGVPPIPSFDVPGEIVLRLRFLTFSGAWRVPWFVMPHVSQTDENL